MYKQVQAYIHLSIYTHAHGHNTQAHTHSCAHTTTPTCLSGLSYLMFYSSASTFLPERETIPNFFQSPVPHTLPCTFV